MALDKQFLKYKLEKIKNDRIWKDQDAETKRRIRKDNAKLAQEEADAIHSYLTGEDPIDAFDNKSFFENPIPGGLFITDRGQLNVAQVDQAGTKKSRLMSLLRKHKSFGGANQYSRKKLIILKKIFDGLNIIFNREEIKLKGKIRAGGYQSSDGQEGITEDYIVSDVIENDDGTVVYIRKRIIVKNGLIVGQQII